MSNDPQSFDGATERNMRELTPDSLEKMRAVSLAGAGVATALVLFILQDAELRRLEISSLVFALSSMPLLLASGFMVENYLVHGEASYKAQARASAFGLMGVVFLAGGISLVASFFFMIRAFFPYLAWYFAAVSFLALIVTLWHNVVTKPRL